MAFQQADEIHHTHIIVTLTYSTYHDTTVMAPPQVTKKSSLTTMTQATSRQGKKQTRKQVVEEETEELEDLAETSSVDSDRDAEDPEGSQDAGSQPLQHLIGTIVGDVCITQAPAASSSLHARSLVS